jgi:hypothetical protein
MIEYVGLERVHMEENLKARLLAMRQRLELIDRQLLDEKTTAISGCSATCPKNVPSWCRSWLCSTNMKKPKLT